MTQTQANKLNALLAEVKSRWAVACEWDGIDPYNKFVIFSPGNPHVAAHAQAIRTFQSLRKRFSRGAVESEQARIKRRLR